VLDISHIYHAADGVQQVRRAIFAHAATSFLLPSRCAGLLFSLTLAVWCRFSAIVVIISRMRCQQCHELVPFVHHLFVSRLLIMDAAGLMYRNHFGYMHMPKRRSDGQNVRHDA
jgi:hypothetical protein